MKRTTDLDDLMDQVGPKPSTKGKTNKTKPETGSKSTQTPEHGGTVVPDPKPVNESADADTGGSDGGGGTTTPPETNNPPAPTAPPAPATAPAALSKPAQARWRHHVRAAAGRLAAALNQVDEARQGWTEECTEASKAGFPALMIQAQALDAGLSLDEVPDNTSK